MGWGRRRRLYLARAILTRVEFGKIQKQAVPCCSASFFLCLTNALYNPSSSGRRPTNADLSTAI
jgi:hypothetical protein